MSRFNSPVVTTITNLAGGQAYAQSPELELISILLTSFANDQFYRSSSATFSRLQALIQLLCSKGKGEFVAKAAVYARKEFGMRSITHVVASELAQYAGGTSWGTSFYKSVVRRPDDITEILSYHLANKGKVTNAMRKGLGASFSQFDSYSLAKYRGEGKEMKLVDAVNMLHPKPNAKNKEALEALIKGELKSAGTWESMLTAAGQNATDEEGKGALKKEAWGQLISTRKIGYFALLRNLRNIIEQAPEALPGALEMLTDEALISKSLVFPFRFQTAMDEMLKLTSSHARMAIVALNKAIEISLKNVPVFIGETLVVLDVSSSMSGRPSEIGSLFAAALVKSNNADLILFASGAGYAQVNISDSLMTIAKTFRFTGGGTNFHSIFYAANKPYDRVIILSDMQGWMGHYSPKESFNEYKKRTGADPHIYSFDLNGYGTMQFPERKVYCVAGFSEKVFDIMSMLEKDRNYMVDFINTMSL